LAGIGHRRDAYDNMCSVMCVTLSPELKVA
jgi:hypothetical protein